MCPVMLSHMHARSAHALVSAQQAQAQEKQGEQEVLHKQASLYVSALRLRCHTARGTARTGDSLSALLRALERRNNPSFCGRGGHWRDGHGRDGHGPDGHGRDGTDTGGTDTGGTDTLILVWRRGCPRSLYSDRGGNRLRFLAHKVDQRLGGTQVSASAHRHRTSGVCERVIPSLLPMLT
jgi:hypothetical protein